MNKKMTKYIYKKRQQCETEMISKKKYKNNWYLCCHSGWKENE